MQMASNVWNRSEWPQMPANRTQFGVGSDGSGVGHHSISVHITPYDLRYGLPVISGQTMAFIDSTHRQHTND